MLIQREDEDKKGFTIVGKVVDEKKEPMSKAGSKCRPFGFPCRRCRTNKGHEKSSGLTSC